MNNPQRFNPNIHQTFLYPTDTIFGLGCSVNNVEAIHKIYEIKERSNHKSFIILVSTERQLQDIVEVPDLAWDILDMAEKPTTIVYDNPKSLPKELLGEDNTIAIRLTKNPLCQRIIKELKTPIVSTSANLSGQNTPELFHDVHEQIKQSVDYIFPECIDFKPKYTASTIIQLRLNGEVKVIRD